HRSAAIACTKDQVRAVHSAPPDCPYIRWAGRLPGGTIAPERQKGSDETVGLGMLRRGCLAALGGSKMMTNTANYEVKCMLCSTEVGLILSGQFKQHAGCDATMPRKGGMLRCCHCGGSLYLDPLEVVPLQIDRAQLAK